MNACVMCYRESELLCQRCRSPYCSRKCQAEDWPEHKTMCIPMPPLVAAKKTESNPRRQANESQKPRQQTYDSRKPKQQSYDSQHVKQQTYDSQKPRQQTIDSQKVKQQANDLQEPKQQANDFQESKQQTNDLQESKQQTSESTASLRPPKTKLPSQITLPTDSKVSLFDNPFKRNSQNIAFKANDIKKNTSPPTDKMPSVNGTEKTEAKAHLSRGDINPTVSIPANKDTITEAFPASVETSAAKDEKAEITVPQSTPGMLPLKEKLKEVVDPQETEEAIFTLNDIEIVPLAAGKKMVCLDSTNIAKGYISSCVNDGKAVAFIDRLSAKITEYCNRTKTSYRPQCDELCLCLLDEDSEWYRAVVSKVIDSDTFEISFIDFGNVTTASSNNIRKMPREFLHHCLVNKCLIKGLQDESTETKMKMAEFFTKTPIFEAAKLERIKNGLYEIELNC